MLHLLVALLAFAVFGDFLYIAFGCTLLLLVKRASSAKRSERSLALKKVYSFMAVSGFAGGITGLRHSAVPFFLVLRACSSADVKLALSMMHNAAYRNPDLAEAAVLKGWFPEMPAHIYSEDPMTQRLAIGITRTISANSYTSSAVLAQAGLINPLIDVLKPDMDTIAQRDALATLMNIGRTSPEVLPLLSNAGVLDRVLAILDTNAVSEETKVFAVGSVAGLLSDRKQCKRLKAKHWKRLIALVPEITSWLLSEDAPRQFLAVSGLYFMANCNVQILKEMFNLGVHRSFKRILTRPFTGLQGTRVYVKYGLALFDKLPESEYHSFS
jgi:hypothetical protein